MGCFFFPRCDIFLPCGGCHAFGCYTVQPDCGLCHCMHMQFNYWCSPLTASSALYISVLHSNTPGDIVLYGAECLSVCGYLVFLLWDSFVCLCITIQIDMILVDSWVAYNDFLNLESLMWPLSLSLYPSWMIRLKYDITMNCICDFEWNLPNTTGWLANKFKSCTSLSVSGQASLACWTSSLELISKYHTNTLV